MTTVTAERVFDHHATALGLPQREINESLGEYTERVAKIAITPAKRAELARCLTEADAAASLADHVNVHHWLNQARQHLPTE